MRILVMGAGAMGSAVGGFMAQAGHDVVLVGRNPHVNALAAHGMRITGIWGEHHVGSFRAYTSDEEVPTEKYDLVLVAVKSYDTESSASFIQPLVSTDTLVCSYQNGLGNAETLAKYFGWERILGARVIFGAKITRPGEVEITVIAEPTAIGTYHTAMTPEEPQSIAMLMNDAGIPTVYTDRIQTVLWSKVAYNCALNPLSALLDVPYGHLSEQDFTRRIMGEVIHELYEVGAAMKIPLEPATSDAYLEHFYKNLLPPTSAHYASMREDLKKGRRTEIDALNGAIVRFGKEHGIVCTANALLTALIHARENKQS